MQLKISGVYVEKSEIKCNNKIYFHKFQEDFIELKKYWLFLETPTGSGKTLAGLAKLTNEKNQKGIFFYPTNELIKDQGHSMVDLLKNLGYDPLNINDFLKKESVKKEKGKNAVISLYKKVKNNPNVALILLINSFELSELTKIVESEEKKKAKGRILHKILYYLSDLNNPFVILTNIDTLYLIISHRYKQASKTFEILNHWNHLIVDEFHLYSGIILANLIFSLSIFYNITKDLPDDSWVAFLSATPSKIKEIFLESFPNDTGTINAKIYCNDQECNVNINKFYKIRYETDLELYPILSVLYLEKDLETVISLVERVIQNPDFKSNTYNQFNVRLLILVNSVIFCEQLYTKIINLKKKISFDFNVERIHGLIPEENRRKIKDLKKSILIGTRAIDLGIDFDVPFLIFEGLDFPTFFQRLGRGGRHNFCKIYALTNLSFYNGMNNRSEKNVMYDTLVCLGEKYLAQEEHFEEFLFSKQALFLIVPLIYNLIPYRSSAILEYKDLLEIYNSVKIFKFKGKTMQNLTIESFRKDLYINKIKQYSKLFMARGVILNLLCYFPQFKTWKRLSFFDLLRCRFSLKKFDNFDEELKKSALIDLNAQKEDYIPIINDFNTPINRLLINPIKNLLDNKLCFFDENNSEIAFEGGNIDNKLINNLNAIINIKYLPFIFTQEVADWKFQSFHVTNSEIRRCFVGETAFLIDFILNSKIKI